MGEEGSSVNCWGGLTGMLWSEHCPHKHRWWAPISRTSPRRGRGAARLWPTPRDGLNYAAGWNHCEQHRQYKFFPTWETRLRCNHPWQAWLSHGIRQGHKCVDSVMEVVGWSTTNILVEPAIGVSSFHVAQRAVWGRTAGLNWQWLVVSIPRGWARAPKRANPTNGRPAREQAKGPTRHGLPWT